MLGHTIVHARHKKESVAQVLVDRSMCHGHGREEIVLAINELHALSRRGLWGILLFLSLSAGALYCSETGLLAMVPAEVRGWFGEPPPAHWLHAALAVSWLSAFVLILGRVAGDGRPTYSWCNVGLPTAFYPLYVFSDQAGTYFPAVFAAGLVLLIVEHASVMIYASKAIRAENSRLGRLQN